MVVLCIHRKYYMAAPMSIAKFAANTWARGSKSCLSKRHMDFLQKVYVLSSGKNFTELGMLAVVNRKAEQGILAPGAIGKIGAIDMQSPHNDQNDSIAFR